MELSNLNVRGTVTTRITRANGETELIEQDNAVTDVGLDYLVQAAMLDLPVAQWHFALRGNGEQAPGDTWGTKRWAEVPTLEGRLPWQPEPTGVPGELSSLAHPVMLHVPEYSVVRGVFLIDTAQGAGRLFMVMRYPRAIILHPGDDLELTYTLSLKRHQDRATVTLACPTPSLLSAPPVIEGPGS